MGKPKEAEKSDNVHPVLTHHGYTVKNEVLGKGTFSTVMSAYSDVLKNDVAIKIIEKVSGAKLLLTKFLPRELETMKNLVHPNIITFYQAIESNLKIYIVLERVKGPSLLLLIQTRGKLSEDQAANILSQLFTGIGFCHNKGIAHRDLKSENILLEYNGIVKIIDFGFARAGCGPIENKEGTRSTTFCGSYAYACPEILRGHAYLPLMADMWSIGVILYSMVYGRLPFEDINIKRLLLAIEVGPVFDERINISVKCKKMIRSILVPEASRPSVNVAKTKEFVNKVRIDRTMVRSSAGEFDKKKII